MLLSKEILSMIFASLALSLSLWNPFRNSNIQQIAICSLCKYSFVIFSLSSSRRRLHKYIRCFYIIISDNAQTHRGVCLLFVCFCHLLFFLSFPTKITSNSIVRILKEFSIFAMSSVAVERIRKSYKRFSSDFVWHCRCMLLHYSKGKDINALPFQCPNLSIVCRKH